MPSGVAPSPPCSAYMPQSVLQFMSSVFKPMYHSHPDGIRSIIHCSLTQLLETTTQLHRPLAILKQRCIRAPLHARLVLVIGHVFVRQHRALVQAQVRREDFSGGRVLPMMQNGVDVCGLAAFVGGEFRPVLNCGLV
jgi:hypothetical protein